MLRGAKYGVKSDFATGTGQNGGIEGDRPPISSRRVNITNAQAALFWFSGRAATDSTMRVMPAMSLMPGGDHEFGRI